MKKYVRKQEEINVKKKVKQLLQRTIAMIMALLTAISIFPISTVMVASEKVTISFEYAYDATRKLIQYQQTVTHGELRVVRWEKNEC